MAEGSSADRRAHPLRRLHALAGAVLGVLLAVHLCANASALGGRASYERVVARVHASPLFVIVEVVVFAALAFYVGYGAVLLRRHGEAGERGSLGVLRRVAGLVMAVFVVAHVGGLRVARAIEGWGASSLYTKLVEHLSSTVWGLPLTAIGYLVAIAASAFFVARGLSLAFAARRDDAPTPDGKRANVAIAALGVALFVVSAASVIALATGRFLPERGASTDPRCEGH